MHIINNAKRLIDFSWNKKKYRLMPAGEAVEVPDDAKKSAFLQTLLKEGEIAEVKSMTKTEKDDAKLSQLQTEAKALGVEFTDKATAKELAAAIKEAEQEKEAEEKAKEEATKLAALRTQATEAGIGFEDDWTVEDLTAEIQFDVLEKKAVALGIEVKEGWDAAKIEKEIKKKEK